MKKVTIVGFGSFGTALAVLLSTKTLPVTVYARNGKWLKEVEDTKENKKYLPGITLPEGITYQADLEHAVTGADVVIFAVPAQHFRENLTAARRFVRPDAIIANVAKGIEIGSLLRMSEVAQEVAPELTYVAISGPSHAEEIGLGLPTTVVTASTDLEAAKKIQLLLMTDRFRVYTNDDLVGVELGGSLKNIMALGAGISDGIGFGDNAKAALMTRGIVEMTRLGIKMGAKQETFAGISGIGDLIVTCTSMHSRNRRCGILIGEGISPSEAVAQIGMVVEGATTCEAAYDMSQKYGVEMPITETIYRCLHEEISPMEGIDVLMNRAPKNE